MVNNNKNNIYKNKIKLHPWYVTGYSDGDSSFSIRTRSSSTNELGFSVGIVYSIGAEINPENKHLLTLIKNYFHGAGSVSKCANMYVYEISSLKSLLEVGKHFEDFPLETSKSIYFKLWCLVMDIIIKKQHLTLKGFLSILSIKSVFPKGLSSKILARYSNVETFVKPNFSTCSKLSDCIKLLNPNWIAGFVQADGTFGLNYTKQIRMRLGYTCQPQFRVTQHERDLLVLKRIIYTLGCGSLILPSSGRDRYDISVGNVNDLLTVIIPFFDKYSLYGAKFLDYKDFSKGLYIIHNKGHLTPKGLNSLKNIAYNMNTYRSF